MRIHMVVAGQVQGVGYRYFVRSNAGRLGISGWVRNCENGDVECEAQGSEESLAQFADQLNHGHPYARVDRLSQIRIADRAGEKYFEIKY